jgi:hypothetical protein
MGKFYFGQVSLVSWKLPVPEWAKLSQDLGKFSAVILLNILCIPFACTSSPSSMPMILRFGLFDGVTEFLHIPFTALELFP